MQSFLYGVALQWKLDIRSKSLFITCYVVPLLFFALMGGIFTSLNPEARYTLIPSMTVMGVSMGALIGLPPSLAEIYGSGSQKMYRANGVPLYLGVVSMALSAFIHLSIMCSILCLIAPLAFDAVLPEDPLTYISVLALFIAVSITLGCVLGLSVKNQAKLTMASQLLFLPSIILTGILFPASLLPRFLQRLGRFFPASWGYSLMAEGYQPGHLWPLAVILAGAIAICWLRLNRLKAA